MLHAITNVPNAFILQTYTRTAFYGVDYLPNKLFGAFYRRTISHAFGEKAGWRNDLNSLFLRAACLYTPDKHLKRS
jgi:hypothetical protein